MNIPGIQNHIKEHIALGIPYGSGKLLTVGNGGNFSTLDDALAVRDTIGHTALATGLTGTITTTGADDQRIITLTTNALSAFIHLNHIGVRLRGEGNPIVRGLIIAPSQIQLLVPIYATHTAVQVDVYTIVPVAISLLPGTIIQLANSTTRYIPAFTTLTCPAKYGASIYHSSTVSGAAFSPRDDQNEIYFTNLVVGDATHKTNSIFWKLPVGTGGLALTEQTDFGITNCKAITASQDLVYTNPTNINGALHLKRNLMFGTFDIVNPTLYRYLDMTGNEVHVASVGDYSDGAGDGGQPTGIPIGKTGNNLAYIAQHYNISNNLFDIVGQKGNTATGAIPTGVDIRQDLASVATVKIANNMFMCRSNDGTEIEGAAGIRVGNSQFTGVTQVNTPTIFATGNTFNCVNNGSPTTAYSMVSNNATYVIKETNNITIAGTRGAYVQKPMLGSGTATVTAAATMVVVTHGLGFTPLITDITIIPTLMSLSNKYWITTLTSTQFTINVDVVPGAGTAVFSWRVD